jgi:hypothetical protein
MTKITVHIGAGKTGSTAIQRFLRINADALASDGVLVAPDNLDVSSPIHGSHVQYFEQLRKPRIEEGDTRVAAALDTFLAAASPPVKQIILSAENLSNLAGWDRLFRAVSQNYEIQVVLYVRRQDDYLLSAWQQWYSKIETDFWSWLTRHVGVMGDWRRPIEQWERATASRNINVRVYDRRRLINGDVIDDFKQFIDAKVPMINLKNEVNRSLNAGALDLATGNRALFTSIADNGFF